MRDGDAPKPGADRLDDVEDANAEFLLELADTLRTPDSWSGPAEAACRLLGEHLAASRVCYLDRARDQWAVRGSYSVDPAHLDDPARLGEVGQNLLQRRGQREVAASNDVQHDARLAAPDRTYLRAIGATAHASVVLTHARRRVATLVVQSATRRVWRRSDLALMAQVADRTWIAAEHASAVGGSILSAETVGMFAHNLRSPLSAILLNATLPLPAHGQEERRSRAPAGAIRHSIAEMNQLLDELVDLSRIATGRLDVYQEQIPVVALLASATAAHRDRAEAQAVALRIDPLPRLPSTWADKRRVLQVFDHLIAGALGAIDGGTIRLGAERANGKIRFSVTATSRRTEEPGPIGHLPRQAPEAPRAAVARSLVHGIVDAHGGDVGIETHAGLGSTVWFTLPCVNRSGADQSRALRVHRRTSGPRSRGAGELP
jgi:signal transduction histidine kinase